MQFNKTLLSNGLRLITVPMDSLESATVLVMVGVGSRYENKRNNGISHFLEHMPYKGTISKPSPMIIAKILDGIGGEWNAFTGKEVIGYYIKSASTHLHVTTELLADLLQHPLLDREEIEKEKGVIIEEMNMYEDNPMRKIGDMYDTLLYGDTPMGWDISGTKEVIRNVKREDFIRYMQSFYSANNITIVVTGGIHEKNVQNLIEKHFGKMKSFPTLKALRVTENQTKPEMLFKKKKIEQAHIALGLRTVPIEHKDRYALDILAAIMGGGTSSRLFYEVREKRGLAYYVRTSSDNYVDCGTLVTSAGVDLGRVEEAVKVIIAETRRMMKKENITKEEIERAKEMIKGHLVLELEDSRSVASFYAHQEILESKVETPEEVLRHIDKVTAEEVKAVAREYLERPLNLALIGNIPDAQRLKKLLQ
ncbi:MAG TPA: pitrilysin family protein [Patescibacteria group bacterium]|nr:pitrilysin family protein [Patescibacteria group bacterium]